MKPEIIFEDNHLLIVKKPVNISVQADSSNDIDLQNSLKEYLKIKYNKPGNVYLGIVHRLDRPVGGIMVFAKTSKSASRLSEQIRKNEFHKQYLTIVDGKLDKSSDMLKNYLFKDENKNLVSVVDEKFKGAKLAILTYNVIDYNDKHSLLRIDLETGRPHQIRVQLSNIGHCIYGDQRYNKNAKAGEQIALWAYKLGLYHPITKEYMEFTCTPPDETPWSEFSGVW